MSIPSVRTSHRPGVLLALLTSLMVVMSGLFAVPAARADDPTYTPAIEVELADGTPLASGDTVYKDDQIVVKGTGFDPLSNPATGQPPVTTGDPAGNYAAFGSFSPVWRPSASAPSTSRVNSAQRWAMTDATYDNLKPSYKPAVTGQRVVLGTDGTFEATLTAAAIPSNKTAWPTAPSACSSMPQAAR